jgi:hypothetical protein
MVSSKHTFHIMKFNGRSRLNTFALLFIPRSEGRVFIACADREESTKSRANRTEGKSEKPVDHSHICRLKKAREKKSMKWNGFCVQGCSFSCFQ